MAKTTVKTPVSDLRLNISKGGATVASKTGVLGGLPSGIKVGPVPTPTPTPKPQSKAKTSNK